MKKKIVKLFLIIIYNFVITLLLLEITGLFLYYRQTNLFYYTNRPQYELLSHTDADELIIQRRLHPIFGFLANIPGTQERSSKLVVNNYGFWSEHGDYPFIKENEKQYVIGLFGGSVSQQLYQNGRHRFIRNLRQEPFFADKEIVVLSFAQGGYKQPQQVIALNYFLSIGQEFDLVINVDGFNEVVLSEKNNLRNVAPSLPSAGHIVQLLNIVDQSNLTPETIELLSQINRNKRRLNNTAELINQNKLASFNLILEQVFLVLQNRHGRYLFDYEQATATQTQDNSLMSLAEAPNNIDEDHLFTQIASHWAESSILMHEITKARGILYFHYLQANQYVTDREFTAEEAAIALNEEHIYRYGVKAGYPFLIEQADRLTEGGVHYYDGRYVFDPIKDTVYVDDCCHYNKLGSELFVDFMTGEILGQKLEDYK